MPNLDPALKRLISAGFVIRHEDRLRALERVRGALGVRASAAKLLLFASAFTSNLLTEASARPDVELVDLDRLSTGGNATSRTLGFKNTFDYGWDRNTFAGVDNRYTVVAGGGRTWFEEESRRFKTDVGLTYTVQDDVVENPDVNDSFMGLRASYDYFRSLTGTTGYASTLVADENLNETDDLRLNWTNSLTVAMSERLALKTSYQILYDNQPALVGVPLQGGGTVLTPLGKTDSVFSVAIVANF